jgi:NADPH-dependent glutamate synthase beta subunit-like oxidoreductase
MVNDELATSLADVYAGGDLVRGAATVVEAHADGMHAAQAIDARLPGAPSVPWPAVWRGTGGPPALFRER